MASSPPPSLVLLLLLVFSTRASRAARAGAVECERLDAGRCAFAVSSGGARCVLEIRSGGAGYACAASEIGAAAFAGLVETDECIAACGLDRRTVGVSSDAFLDDRAVRGLCSMECLTECPNIVHLFSNLAAGEGVYFFQFCASKQEKRNHGRRMVEMRSSGGAALNPAETLFPPAQAPTHI